MYPGSFTRAQEEANLDGALRDALQQSNQLNSQFNSFQHQFYQMAPDANMSPNLHNQFDHFSGNQSRELGDSATSKK